MTNDDEPTPAEGNPPVNSVQCACGNLIVAEGEKITCNDCDRTWWVTMPDERTRDAAQYLGETQTEWTPERMQEQIEWFKNLLEMSNQNNRYFKR